MAIALMACNTSKNAVDPQQAAAVKSLLENQQYFVMVGSMRPLSAPTMSVSQGQKMIVRNGTVTCYLPYAGSGQNVGYGASGFKALNFSAPMLDYKVEYPKPDRARITFKVDNGVRQRLMLSRVDEMPFPTVACFTALKCCNGAKE